jgi:hypothetical protein
MQSGKATKNAPGASDTTTMIPQSERVMDAAQPAVSLEAAPAEGTAAPREVASPRAGEAEPGGREHTGRFPVAGRPSGASGRWSPPARLSVHFGLALLVASAGAALLGGARSGVSAALGVMLAGTNLLLMRKITAALVDASGAAAAWALALPFKLVVLVGFAYALVESGVARPVPLAMGFALLPLTGVFLPRASSVPDLAAPIRR